MMQIFVITISYPEGKKKFTIKTKTRQRIFLVSQL